MEKKVMMLVKENTRFTFTSHGWGNGYAIVFKGHPAYEKGYDDIDVSVHGGLTFAESINSLNWDEITEEMKDGWIVGFDTCHYGDTKRKWSKKMVVKETENLKDQLEKMI